jgi:thiol-disulfide isomerase/thioredoxin
MELNALTRNMEHLPRKEYVSRRVTFRRLALRHNRRSPSSAPAMTLSAPDLQTLLAATLAGRGEAGAVICLCADWCSTCRDYRAVFDQAAAAHPGLAFRWLDIEDEAGALGDVDVETFPTLLIGDARAVRFAGPVLPQAGHLARLLQSLAF